MFSRYHKKETHGLHNGIDENTTLDDVKAPNVFQRAKEEFQAIVHVFHQKKNAPTCAKSDENQMVESKIKHEIPSSSSETETKAESIFVRAKREIKAIIHHDKSSQHHCYKETHGWKANIDENTPIGEVKGPNIYERVKEEFEAVSQVIRPKKES